MTANGLTTANLSPMTAWQQTILYMLMALGDVTVVSWVMVLVRKYYFVRKLEYVVHLESPKSSRRPCSITANIISPPIHNASLPHQSGTTARMREEFETNGPDVHMERQGSTISTATRNAREQNAFLSDIRAFSSSPTALSDSSQHAFESSVHPGPSRMRSRIDDHVPLPHRHITILENSRQDDTASQDVNSKYKGLGGFPGPVTLARRSIQRTFPALYRTLERSSTLPRAITLNRDDPTTLDRGENTRTATWLTFDELVVGRNSDFHTHKLNSMQLEELGGIEYRALTLLSYLIPAYFLTSQLVAFLIIAPWLSASHRYDSVFDGQPRVVQKPWFSLFQVMGGYTGAGLTLVDEGMVPFQTAYLMIFPLLFVILAGGHALPILLRLTIWIGSKLTPTHSRTNETCHFLLDHPRRCLVYMFPSHQTWFLVICLVTFSGLQWAAFSVLDIGLDAYDSLPRGPKAIAGLLACRASGLSIISLADLAPALHILYLLMMYIDVYPVAMTVRSTNVYEERSLAVFEDPPDDAEPDLGSMKRRQRITRYLGWHIQRQFSNEIWWLVIGVFVVAIIERHDILDPSKDWFDLFRVVFELVSAFGGVGLSFGLPTDNFSLSGAMKPLSKIVIIIVMLKGRHRGLPVAIDRAILLPMEFRRLDHDM